MGNTKFILASASPRRKELLGIFNVEFDIVKSNFDEAAFEYNGIDTGLYVQELALLKANSVAGQIAGKEDSIIISADTIVCLDDKILGKPNDENEAFAMLKMLSGRKHQVRTGVCVYRLPDGTSTAKHQVTEVTVKELTDEKIRAYIATGEPMDKAGAYGIQGIGSTLIEKIDGDYFNVVGLPISLLADILEDDYNIVLF